MFVLKNPKFNRTSHSYFLFFASSFVEHDGSTDRFSPSVDPPFSSPPSDLAVLHVDLPALVLHHWC